MTLLNHDVSPDSARAYLDSLILHGVKLGLHNIERLMEASGRPHLDYPTVHVAGTNGKGSVLSFLQAILSAAGCRVGRFTSPHLLDVTERFLIDGRPMDEAALRENVDWFRAIAETMTPPPTYFEMNAALAFRWFAQEAVDAALIEVGMGGRFDATNIVSPKLCAIATIDYDHMQYLGDTLEKIAFEKAGILKKGAPAVIGRLPEGPLRVIREQALARGVSLLTAGEDFVARPGGTPLQPTLHYESSEMQLDGVALGLLGRHQADNAAIAATLAAALRDTFPSVTKAAIVEGLGAARWPGRLERVLDDPPVFMDAAHNPAGCRTLADAMEQCVVVFSVSSDKNAAAMLDILAPLSAPLILTQYVGERCMPLEQLRREAGNHPHLAFSSQAEALEAGMALARRDLPLLIAGSIYAAGEARRILVDRHGAQAVSFGAQSPTCRR